MTATHTPAHLSANPIDAYMLRVIDHLIDAYQYPASKAYTLALATVGQWYHHCVTLGAITPEVYASCAIGGV